MASNTWRSCPTSPAIRPRQDCLRLAASLDPDSRVSPARLDEVRGQAEAKLALQVAAAGGHGVSDRTAGRRQVLAQRLVDLLPPMAMEERVEVTTLLSATGRWPEGSSRDGRSAPAPHDELRGIDRRRQPHLRGRDLLAHRGVLFLDELPEFGRDALEGLRQPLEAKESISHAPAGARPCPHVSSSWPP